MDPMGLSGYDQDPKRMCGKSLRNEVLISINKHCLEITDGVNVSKDDLEVDAENRI